MTCPNHLLFHEGGDDVGCRYRGDEAVVHGQDGNVFASQTSLHALTDLGVRVLQLHADATAPTSLETREMALYRLHQQASPPVRFWNFIGEFHGDPSHAAASEVALSMTWKASLIADAACLVHQKGRSPCREMEGGGRNAKKAVLGDRLGSRVR